MDVLGNLFSGFATAITIKNLYLASIGCLWGTIVGVLPGIGPVAGITLLIPATFGIDATGAIIMLAGIYYGAMYGLDDLNPNEYPWRGCLCHHLS